MVVFDACVLGLVLIGLAFVASQLFSAPRRARVLAVAWEPRLRKIVREPLGVQDEPILVDLWLRDLLADRTVRFGLGLAIGTEFAVDIPDAALRKVRTYGDLVRIVAHALAQPTAKDSLSIDGDPRRAA
jgi:acyl carrier protein